MDKLQAEANVLDRIMYVLEEYPVQYLAEQDEVFAGYISKLYSQVRAKSSQLRGHVA
jgi:hypothetical protein